MAFLLTLFLGAATGAALTLTWVNYTNRAHHARIRRILGGQ